MGIWWQGQGIIYILIYTHIACSVLLELVELGGEVLLVHCVRV